MNDYLTVFANFYIDNEERLQRLKDSFCSMKEIRVDQYVVNVRGKYSKHAIEFLKKNACRISIFSIESTIGWFYDTGRLFHLIKTPYTLIWLEDHICTNPKLINTIVEQMDSVDADILTYSFWQNGNFLKRYNKIPQNDWGEITWFDHTVDNNYLIQDYKNNNTSYIIALPSIIKTALFKKIIFEKERNIRWPKFTPFDFEKKPEDVKWLSLRRANPKRELFASIDDDHGDNGYSLQSRKLYPIRTERQSYAEHKPNYWKSRVQKVICTITKFRLVLWNLFFTPPSYFAHFIRSNYNPCNNASLPWMNYRVIKFIIDKLPEIKNVFEFGAGQSTVFWKKNNVNITSVEHDPEFISNLHSKYFSVKELGIMLIEPELDDDSDGTAIDNIYRSSDFKGYNFLKYAQSIDHFDDNFFDLVVIDGRARQACIRHSVSKVRHGGMLIFDNSDRYAYQNAIQKYLNNWKRITFKGSVQGLLHREQTTVFFKPLI